MSASRPLALCRSLSDSGFEITAQESDLARYNPYLINSQNGDAAMGARDRLKRSPCVLDVSSQSGDLFAAERRVSVMDHSLGVLDMVLDSISRELEPPLVDNSAPSHESVTEVKTVVEQGDLNEVDQTEVKALEAANDAVQQPPEYGDITQGDLRHLMDSMAEVHKKLDLLQGKMNNLLTQKKPDSEPRVVAPKGIDMEIHQEIGKKIFQRESTYVQLEQVYYNLQRINFLHRPKNSFIQKCTPLWKSDTVQKKTVPTQITKDRNTEVSDLKDSCLRLEQENLSLREELKRLQESMKKTPPVPAPRQPRVKPSSSRAPESKPSRAPESKPSRAPESKPSRAPESKPSKAPESEGCCAQAPEQEPLYTLVNCVVGPPTTPPKDVRMTEVTYEWIIPDYNRQFQEQRSGWVHKTMSAPFFITHNGYRARMEAFFDGDGWAKGSYFSVFFRVLPSKMDDQLTWPLKLRLTFIIINQTDKPNVDNQSRRGIIEHSFPRPSSNGMYEHGESDCWGLLNLVSHEKIRSQQFIRKDKLLLQCQVQILPSSGHRKATSSQ